MSKTYKINGVEVSYEVFDKTMNGDPNDFGNLNNIDAPDIPQTYKDAYANDLRNERAGRGHPWWTPRKRMVDNIAHNEKVVAEKKAKRLQARQEKMDAWGEQLKWEREESDRRSLWQRQEATQKASQADEDKKSAIGMTLIIGGGLLLMCLLFALTVFMP